MTRLDLWKKRISEQKSSGLTKKTWCAQQGMNYHTTRYWDVIINKVSLEKENLIFKELPISKASSLKIKWQHIAIEIDTDFDESTLTGEEVTKRLAIKPSHFLSNRSFAINMQQ